MPLDIDGSTFFTANELLVELGLSRQTLWRWRQAGKVPTGNRYRGHQVIFTCEEANRVREHARRIDPIDSAAASGTNLIKSNGRAKGSVL